MRLRWFSPLGRHCGLQCSSSLGSQDGSLSGGRHAGSGLFIDRGDSLAHIVVRNEHIPNRRVLMATILSHGFGMTEKNDKGLRPGDLFTDDTAPSLSRHTRQVLFDRQRNLFRQDSAHFSLNRNRKIPILLRNGSSRVVVLNR